MSAGLNITMWAIFGVSLTALVYSHVVYPLMMVLVSRRRVAPPVTDEWPTVSLIIPAHNESLVIEAKLENAIAIDYPPDKLEVIVASDGSDDDTLEKARAFEDRGVRVLDLNPRRGKASVLNDAVEASRGDVLCLCDANVMFRPDAIRKLVAHLADPNIGAATGDVRLASEQSDFGEGESLYYRLERAIQLGESRLGSLVCVDGGMYVLRRELFRPLLADTVLDDFTTTINVIRQGMRVVYEPAAIADENGTPSWKQEFRRRVRTSIGAVQSFRRGNWPPLCQPLLLWQYISHKLLRWSGPVWLIGLGVSSLSFCGSSLPMKSFVMLQGAIYLSAAVALTSRRLRMTRLCGIPFYFIMSHCAIGAGTILGACMRASGTWSRTERLLEQKHQHQPRSSYREKQGSTCEIASSHSSP